MIQQEPVDIRRTPYSINERHPPKDTDGDGTVDPEYRTREFNQRPSTEQKEMEARSNGQARITTTAANESDTVSAAETPTESADQKAAETNPEMVPPIDAATVRSRSITTIKQAPDWLIYVAVGVIGFKFLQAVV